MRKSLLIILLTAGLVLLLVGCNKQPQAVSSDTKDKSFIYGKWASEKGTLFEFTEDGRYGWYKDQADVTDNYYKGPFKLLNGKEAMEELGITEEEFNRAYKKYSSSMDNIFSIKMYPETLHSEGIDKSSNLNKEGYYHFTFIISSENKDEAIAINVSEPAPFKVTRVK